MRLPLRTVLRAATGVVRPGILLMLLLVFTAIGIMVALLTTNATSAASALTAVATAANFFLALAIAPSCLLVQRTAWQARIPGLRAAATAVPICVALLSIVLPTVCIAWSGAGNAWWTFAVLVCGCMVCLCWLMLPMLVALLLPSLLGWIVREVARLAPTLDLGPAAAPAATLRLLATALVLALLIALRWRQLITKPQLSLSFHSSILEKVGATPDMLQSSVNNPNAASQQIPSWLMPRMSRRLSATPGARLRTVLGPPFTPGYQRRMALYFLLISGTLALFTLSQPNPHVGGGQMLRLMGSNLLFGIIGGSCIAYAQRLALIFRPHSGELTELALLPSLNARAPAWRGALQAMIAAVTQTFASFFMVGLVAILAGVASSTIHLAMAWCAVVWLLQIAMCLRHLSAGRRLIDNAGASTLLWMLLLILSLGALAGIRELWNLWDGPGRILIGPVVGAGLAWLALAMRRWYRHAARLPQPFMIAADRRNAPKEFA